MKPPNVSFTFRILFAFGIAAALPFSHMIWGENYPGDGQQDFGFITIFAMLGSVMAAAFLGLSSLGQFLLRRQPARFTVVADIGLFVVFFGAMIYSGVTAKYSDLPPDTALQQTASGRR